MLPARPVVAPSPCASRAVTEAVHAGRHAKPRLRPTHARNLCTNEPCERGMPSFVSKKVICPRGTSASASTSSGPIFMSTSGVSSVPFRRSVFCRR